MILTVTLNAALDATWSVDSLRPRTSHRVESARERAGGKGINVARVLGILGHDPVATGLVGGPTGRRIRDELRTARIRNAFFEVVGESRRTLAVVSRDDGDATVFNGRGPFVASAEWQLFRRHFAALVAGARVVVLSGSTPPGLPPDAYAQLVRTAAAAGALTVLDTSGPALLNALAAHPDVVKPNADEIAAVTDREDLAEGAAALRALGARTVVASAGADGLHAVTTGGTWRAKPPERLSGNPTGAGDACVAAIAAGLEAGSPWPEILRTAVALSAAAVPCPVAGEVDFPVYHRLLTKVAVERIPPTGPEAAPA
ncbi:1-phosphofructokinase family hexose kinase [Kitasatospora sp. NPDC059327]|uniref:1-phosphofructokinase family hexose kinase n=1 Tax=Kitasatospora sp. NPDC059327 TaxID=3346803 RepID=UPI00367A5224